MIKVDGLDEIRAKLDSIGDTEHIVSAMGKACALVENSARHKAPKDNGELKRSITSEVKTEGEEVKGIVYTPLDYAPYVEFGTGLFAEDGGRTDVPWCYKDDEGHWHTTSGQHPQPFMRPALDENKDAIVRLVFGGLLND